MKIRFLVIWRSAISIKISNPVLVLKSIEDAIQFNNFHEGIHLGYILALKKAL